MVYNPTKMDDLGGLPYLVGGIPTPLKNMSSSVGLIIPNIWKNNPNVPNHQSVILGKHHISPCKSCGAGSPVTSDGVCNGHRPENRGQTEKDACCASGQ